MTRFLRWADSVLLRLVRVRATGMSHVWHDADVYTPDALAQDLCLSGNKCLTDAGHVEGCPTCCTCYEPTDTSGPDARTPSGSEGTTPPPPPPYQPGNYTGRVQ